MKTGIELIAAERDRQVNVEGWSAQYDDGHSKGELGAAAIAYVANGCQILTQVKVFTEPRCKCGARGLADCSCALLTPDEKWVKPWPWAPTEFNPKPNPVADLVRAGALIAAEIDRLLRKQEWEKLNAAAEEEQP